jgi:glycosyltransferase involved in cell wall biosynthesis
MKAPRYLKICLVSYPLSLHGGIQTVARMIIRVFAESSSFRLQIVYVGSGNFAKICLYLNLLFYVLRGFRIMFMHAYLYQACPRHVWRLCQSRPIVWCHGVEVWGNYSRERLPSLANGPVLWAVSHFTADRIKENWPRAIVQIVPLAVMDYVGRASSRFVPSSTNVLRLLTVSRLDAHECYKGHELSLLALARLRREGIPFRLDIVGDGDDRLRLEALSQEIKVGDSVVFHGPLDHGQLHQLYTDADLFLMPSQLVVSKDGMWGGEGFGLVYIEAALYGVPSITGQAGGHTDFVENNVTGWHVPNDVNALSQLLSRLAHNPDEVFDCGMRSYFKAKSQYSFGSFAQNLHRALLSHTQDLYRSSPEHQV